MGPVLFFLARHFGLCFGVENAIDIAYQAVADNPGRRIFLLSEMIHNPRVNADLLKLGVRFLRDTHGKELLAFETVTADDVVIIPAFGTNEQDENRLREMGVRLYNTTCPFVKRVWNRIEQISKQGYTIIVHGKAYHEETKATFSRACDRGPALVVQNRQEIMSVAAMLQGNLSESDFLARFGAQCSPGFSPSGDLARIGMVNQTTMLADETKLFSRFLRRKMVQRYGIEEIQWHYSDGKDTLCYATNENQRASRELMKVPADLALIVGGFNSSNTSHLYQLFQQKIQTYYISGAQDLQNRESIRHLVFPRKIIEITKNWLPKKKQLTILLSAGASSPDILVEEVMRKIAGFCATSHPSS